MSTSLQAKLDLPRARRHTRQGLKPIIKDKKQQTSTIINKKQDELTAIAKQPISLGIHQEHLTDIDKLLKAFDLNYIYGPCVGLTRLDRWERAQRLSLNPPKLVKEILLNDKSQKYKHSLFHQFRMI
ncbi:DNA polymerase delta, subunit 4-domain-containing protein [Cokeromyces recurvatus]|uniref:DNA polymerase delta, subunit 4-domain-containing protein n=1 Tax=Cokeromyces recurvatus TaxID=90255 RepID=UPI00221E91A1|nr:DNA polymerase delta, subunit 4-domain-containing protein [Cokeromyces recurvatus]KAI7904201.1 DNA polymerase delta, subunit 4-domain-containing protein [Cokeromyces recurvatus]